MDIIFLEPVYKDYIWGGESLKNKLNKNTPYKKTAESWEISANNNGICKLKNQDKTLKDIFEDELLKEKIFGTKCTDMKEFPILIKFIDAKDNLSIQVHPDDEYAKKNGFSSGKNEMWYIMDCEKDSQIIGGLSKKLSERQLEDIIKHNQIKEFLNYINVKPGDSIYIPAGTVHAILKNTLICEIQQNCDITYRIYDWDRIGVDGKSRPLHKKEAIQTIHSENMPEVIETQNRNEVQIIAKSELFEVEKVKCKDIFIHKSDASTFYAINIVKGKGVLEYNGKKIDIKIGDSFIIPATLGEYKISGEMEFLKTRIVSEICY